jgi:hypothetical protein
MLSKFNEKVPSVVCKNNMGMKIQTNLSPNNSWTVTYGAIDTDKFFPITKVESNASVGATCPFIVLEASGPDCVYNSGLMFTFLFCYSFYMSPMYCNSRRTTH